MDAFKRKMIKAGQSVEAGAKERTQRRMWCGLNSMKVAAKEDSTGNSAGPNEVSEVGKQAGKVEGWNAMDGVEEGKVNDDSRMTVTSPSEEVSGDVQEKDDQD